MKALVVGASGLTGRALKRVLEQNGVDILGTYNSRPIPGGIKLDILDAEAVDSCLREIQPDVVFLASNLAGGVDYCEDHPDKAFALHLDGTRHIASAAAKYRAKVIYYSTDYVFDGNSGPYSEEDEPNPISVYGQTKLEAERILQAESKDALIIRTTVIYGWDPTSINFAMQVWNNLQVGQEMKVPNDQIGNPTLVDYLAEVSLRLVQMNVSGMVNVVGKDLMSRSEFGRALARAMALNQSLIRAIPTSELNQRALRPLQGGLRTDKLRELLGTEPMPLAEAIKRLRRQWRADTYVAAGPTRPSSEAEKLKQEILEKVQQYYHLVHENKEFTPFESFINYSGRVFNEQEMVNLTDSALDFWLTLGPYGDLFESKMKRFLGCQDFALVNSGSSANLTAVMTLMSPQVDGHLNPGDEVITPSVTFPTTLAPLVQSGLVPVFVDCELGTYNIDPEQIEAAISPRTKAMMLPHTLGNPLDMDVVTDIVRRYRLFLIEDSCDALGATFNGKRVGTFGDLATLSFYPAHQMTMGEGGGVIVNKARLSKVVRSIRDWGRDCWCAPGESNTCGKRFGWCLGELPQGYDHKYMYSNLGYNLKPTDLQAAIGVAQLDKVPDFVERRRSNFNTIYKALEPYQDYLILPVWHPKAEPSWFGFPLTVKNGLSKSRLVQWLEAAKIETREVFAGNILRQPGYQNIKYRVHGDLQNSERIMRETFFIGVYPGITKEMLKFIIDRFEAFFRGKGERW